jgi:hypothetical protein
MGTSFVLDLLSTARRVVDQQPGDRDGVPGF